MPCFTVRVQSMRARPVIRREPCDHSCSSNISWHSSHMSLHTSAVVVYGWCPLGFIVVHGPWPLSLEIQETCRIFLNHLWRDTSSFFHWLSLMTTFQHNREMQRGLYSFIQPNVHFCGQYIASSNSTKSCKCCVCFPHASGYQFLCHTAHR